MKTFHIKLTVVSLALLLAIFLFGYAANTANAVFAVL